MTQSLRAVGKTNGSTRRNQALGTTFLAPILLLTTVFSLPDYGVAATKFEEVFREVNGVRVTCRKTKTAWIPGSGKGKRFTAYKYTLGEFRKDLVAAQKRKDKKAITRFKKKVTYYRELISTTTPVCNNAGENPTPPGGEPNNPIPLELSLDLLARPATEEDLMYLLEKAGYGYNPKRDAYLKGLLASGGISAVVDDLLTPKPETPGLEAMTYELLDDNRKVGSTKRLNYTINGMRKARTYFSMSSINPVLTRLSEETFFGKWTVNDRALANGLDYSMFWEYRNLLRDFALNGDTDLRKVLTDISKSPMMLRFLDNASSTPGNPNENYAREIQELFSMGTSRWAANCSAKIVNYKEEYQGLRQFGDIFQMTLAFTGYAVFKRTIDGEDYLRSAYVEADHRAGPKIVYRGTENERTIDTLEDGIEAIIAHKGTSQGLAMMYLQAYLDPDPPCEVVVEFARILDADGLNLRKGMAKLLKSNVFYNARFKDRVIKSPLHRTAQFVNTLGLTPGPEDLVNRTTQIIESDIGTSIGRIVNALDAMGNLPNSPATVFYYDEKSFYSSLAYAEQANLYIDLASDSNTISKLVGATTGSGNNIQYLYYANWRPPGEILARQVILDVANRLRVPLTPSQVDQLEFFMNNYRDYNDPSKYIRDLYDNAESEDKLIRLYALIASMPRYYTA